MKTIFETNRLIFRQFNINDALDMYHLNLDPLVLKYTGDVAFTTIKNAENFIKNYNEYIVNGFGRWAVILKENNKFIGWCGLKRNSKNFIDIGFRFFKNQWNNGYATEAAKATLNYGFTILNLQEIIGRAAIKNTASIKILEKLNMQFLKFDNCNGIKNAVYYKITKSQYLKTRI